MQIKIVIFVYSLYYIFLQYVAFDIIQTILHFNYVYQFT